MNTKEKIILLVLIGAFLSGTIVRIFKKWKMNTQVKAISLELIRKENDNFLDTLIDLNSANREELEALPGIGPILAQRIINYREKHKGFKNINELRYIPGIGPKRFSLLKNLVTVRSKINDSID